MTRYLYFDNIKLLESGVPRKFLNQKGFRVEKSLGNSALDHCVRIMNTIHIQYNLTALRYREDFGI